MSQSADNAGSLLRARRTVAIDAGHIVGESRFRGVGTHVRGLLTGLGALDNGWRFVLVGERPPEEAELNRPPFSFEKARGIETDPTPWRFFRRQVVFPFWLAGRGFDLLHVPFSPDAPVYQPVPTVITVHDLNIYVRVHLTGRRAPVAASAKHGLALRRARRLMTDSEATAREVVELCGVDPRRIDVVYSAVDDRFHPLPPERVEEVLRRHGLSRGYILYVGAYDYLKNLPFLVHTFADLTAAGKLDRPLVLVGQVNTKPPCLQVQSAIRDCGLEGRVVMTGHVDADELPALYCGASMFLFPSLFEGFGLPPAEAMACGTPVITSNRSSLPEVVGDAGLLIDPTDQEQLGRAILRLAADDALRAELRSRGLKQAARFTWETAARKTLDSYERALGADHA